MSLEFVGFHYHPVVLLYAFLSMLGLFCLMYFTNQLYDFFENDRKKPFFSIKHFLFFIKKIKKSGLKQSLIQIVSSLKPSNSFFKSFKIAIKSKKWWLKLVIFFFEGIVFSIIFFRLAISPRLKSLHLNAIEVIRLDTNLVLISFETKLPEAISLEVHPERGKAVKILPTNTFRPQLKHNFLVENHLSAIKLIIKRDQTSYYLNGHAWILDNE